jgi:hypothetical protein
MGIGQGREIPDVVFFHYATISGYRDKKGVLRVDRLPIYRLRGGQIGSAMLIDMAARVFGIEDNFKISDLGPRLSVGRRC